MSPSAPLLSNLEDQKAHGEDVNFTDKLADVKNCAEKHATARSNVKMFVLAFLFFDLSLIVSYCIQLSMEWKSRADWDHWVKLVLDVLVISSFLVDVVLGSWLHWTLSSQPCQRLLVLDEAKDQWTMNNVLIGLNWKYNKISLSLLACQRLWSAGGDPHLMSVGLLYVGLLYVAFRASKLQPLGQLHERINKKEFPELLKDWAAPSRFDKVFKAIILMCILVIVMVLVVATIMDGYHSPNGSSFLAPITTTMLPAWAGNVSYH